MTDMENVIKWFEDVHEYIRTSKDTGQRKARMMDKVTNAIELLKEQEEEIESLKQTAQNMMEGICLLKKQETVEPFHKCIGKEFSLIEDSHFDYCPYCGKPITWAKQESR